MNYLCPQICNFVLFCKNDLFRRARTMHNEGGYTHTHTHTHTHHNRRQRNTFVYGMTSLLFDKRKHKPYPAKHETSLRSGRESFP